MKTRTGYDFSMSSSVAMAGVVSFEEARRIVEAHAAKVRRGIVESTNAESGKVEVLSLPAARGRVLSEALVADRDFPPFLRATRDGYAVRAADVEQVPARLEVIGEIKAGESREIREVGPGQAVSIMTGAPLPAGADAVVMVEYTAEIPHPNVAQNATLEWGTHGLKAPQSAAFGGKFVEIQRSVKSGENFVPRGAEARAGKVLVEPGRRLDHSLMAIAAAVGKSGVRVFRKPRVAVLSTGDELVEIGATPGPSQIRNSNSYSLAAQVQEAGGEAVRLPIAPDEPGRLRALIEEGLAYDLLLLTGGVSMGKYDLVEQVLGELEAEFYFTGARIQPGKPVVFGSCPASAGGFVRADSSSAAGTRTGMSAPHEPVFHYFFGLPGNPVSTMVTFRLFVEPVIAALAGARAEPLAFLKVRLKKEVWTKTGLTRFLPAVISGEFTESEVELAAWQGSGDIAALARANCYLVVPPDREQIPGGELVSVLLA
ncbi:MAG: gephyrin-like molybdotransferase Glp [Terriglobales bacterium]